MEKQKLLNADYLDILFDNRNKTYGGYDLRRKYPDRAKRATYMVLLAAGLLSSIPVIASVLNGRQPHADLVFKTDRVIKTVDVIVPKKENPPVKPLVKQVEAASIAATVAVRPLVIKPTDQVPTDAPPTLDSLGDRLAGLNNNAGNDNGLVADNGQQDGLGQILNDPPPIDPPAPKGPMTVVSQMPQFNGDVADYLNKHLRYPEDARGAQQEGRAVVKFVINEDGAVTNTEIVRSAGFRSLDNEALRVVSAMPNWKAGKQQGVAVKVYFNLPISFKLE